MTTVASTLKMFDSMTGPLKKITSSMNIMISTMHQMQNATNQNVNMDKSLSTAKRQIAEAEVEINRSIDQANKSQQQFNRSVNNGTASIGKLGGAIIVMNQGLQLARGFWDKINRSMTYADDILSMNTRLGMINDGLRTQAGLQTRVMDVANRTRSSYQATADLVSKLGLFTQGVFKNNDGMIDFAERFNKVLYAGGANAVSREIAAYQMSQALASGRLQGDELRSISEAAPGIMKVLADGIGVARGSLKKMGADGELTADVIVRAFEKQSKEIDQMFSTMPMTFGGAMTIMGNKFAGWVGKLNEADGPLRRVTGRMEQFSKWLDTAQGTQLFANLTRGVEMTINGLMWLLTLSAQTYSFFVTNWTTIEPIFWGLVGVFGAWLLVTRLQAAAQVLLTLWMAATTAALYIQTAAVLGLRTAWQALNTAQKANVFILIISLIVALIVWIVHLWKTNDQFAAALMRAWNAILNFFDRIPAYFWQLVEWMLAPYVWWAEQVGSVYDAVINGIIKGMNKVLSIVNKVTGSSFEIEAKFNIEEITKGIQGFAAGQKAAALSSASYNAAARERNVQDMLEGRATARAAEAAKKQSTVDLAALPGMGPNIDKVGEVGKIRDTVDISSQDLKMMRELAEMKNIQNFVTLQPSLQVTTGDIRQDSDIETIVSRIDDWMNEQLASSAKGVWNV